jgi:hypothetical protein
MIVKFFKGGRTAGGAKSAVNYLLNERTATGEAELVRGDPDLTLKIIKEIDNKWKFSSGVISFSEAENFKLDDEKLEKIMDEFERTFFPGMEKDEYNILWVKHTDKGRTELHFIAPRIHLPTWKAYNPYLHKKDLKKKDLFQDYINQKFGLYSPKLTSRYATKHETKWTNEANELRKEINEYVEYAIEHGLVSDRDEIIELLKEGGLEVTRKGKKYISVKAPGMKKAIRLKGAVYEETWSIGKSSEEERARNRRELFRDIDEIREELEKRIRKDIAYVRARYQKRSAPGKTTAPGIKPGDRLNPGRSDNVSELISDDEQLSVKTKRPDIYGLRIQMDDAKIEEDENERIRELIERIREARRMANETLAGLERAIEEDRQKQREDRLINALFLGFSIKNKHFDGASRRIERADRELGRQRREVERYIQELDEQFIELTKALGERENRRQRIKRLREGIRELEERIQQRQRRMEQVVKPQSRGFSL